MDICLYLNIEIFLYLCMDICLYLNIEIFLYLCMDIFLYKENYYYICIVEL